MKHGLIAALAAGLFSAAPAFATAITIDFEGPSSFQSIDQFYNGGQDGGGLSGPNLGVSFGLDAQAVQNDVLGPYFSNAPSPLGVMLPVGGSAAMNVAAGFSGLASFYYSSSSAGVVYVWSGVDGTGTLLDAFTLTNNAQAGGCSDSPLCHWDPATVNLGSKVAKSITFGDAAGVAGFDNVSVNTVPEPESYALMVLGLAAIGVWLRSARGRQARA